MGQIVEHYVLLANKALAKKERIKADRYIARGLSMQPDNSKLLALKEGLQVASASTDAPIISLGLDEDAASQVEGTREGINNIFTRLKAFFDSHAKARSEVLATNQQTSSSLYE